MSQTPPMESLPPFFTQFIRANPQLTTQLDEEARPIWFEICRTVPRLRGQIARQFFLQLHAYLQDAAGHPHRDEILQWALNFGAAKWVLVLPYFKAVGHVRDDAEFLDQWAGFSRRLAEKDIDLALAFLELTPKALDAYGKDNLIPKWGSLGLEAISMGRAMWKAARACLQEAAGAQISISPERWRFILGQAARIAPKYQDAAEEFIRSGVRCCMLLTESELEQWVTEGLDMAAGVHIEKYGGVMKRGMGARQTEPDQVTKFFSGTSLDSVLRRDRLATGLALKDRANTLALICEAFRGRPVKIRDNSSLAGFQGFSGGAATDGITIFLPANLPNFGLYKLMALHQTALLDDPVWQSSETPEINPLRLHLEADRLLLDHLPGLRKEMEAHVPGMDLPSYYPKNLPTNQPLPLIWWGDILPDLASRTRKTIHKLKLRASEEVDLPPELIEALLSSMMADGERDPDSLWGRLSEMFEAIEWTSPDPEELKENFKTFFYKEWDANLGDYKLDWALVRQRFPAPDPNQFVERTVKRMSGLISLIRRQFTRLKPEQFKKFKAEPFGDDLDIDALVEAFVEMRSGSYLADRIYIRRDKRARDVGVLFLLDLSGSTEEMVEDRRVIDIQKEAMVLMAEALDTLGDPYSIFGFRSEGRFRVDMFMVKDFGEAYGETAKNRLGNLSPKGLTRMGAVIRHATHRLDMLPAAIKLMIILTDGRPYDLEYGDVNYAIEDTKKALQEARARRINPFIITSDQKGAEYLKRISPQMQSIILPKVELLPMVLPAMYKRLTT